MSGKIGGKSNDQNKVRLFDLLESYMMYCREEGYTDFTIWCQDNIDNVEQEDLLVEMRDKVNAVMGLLCFDNVPQPKAKKHRWITFSLKGKEIAAISIKGSFPGEVEETTKLLAYEKNVDPGEIVVGTR